MYFSYIYMSSWYFIKILAKRKLEISDEKEVTVYTEDDGTEIDEADTEELWCHCQEPEYGYISIIY